MTENYHQILVQNVLSLVPNSHPIKLNYVSQEHRGWFAFAEIETKYFLTKILRDDAVLMDVGANIGMYSALFLKLFSKSQVFAFEPSNNFQFLEKNIPRQLKSRFKAYKVALGDINGMIVSEIWESYGHNKVEDRFQFLTLDRFCESEQLKKIDLVKIDTDGFETQILQGGGNTFSRLRPILIIESEPNSDSGQSLQKIDAIMQNLDYLHLATLDGNNELYVHQSDDRMQDVRRFIKRNIFVGKTFLGTLVTNPNLFQSKFRKSSIRFSSAVNARVFLHKLFLTNGIPWNYAAISSEIQSIASHLEISGVLIGSDANLICISNKEETLFTFLLPCGIYHRILIPIMNMDGVTSFRIAIRTGARKGKTLIAGLTVNLVH